MALVGFLPPSSYNTGSALVRASTRKVVIKKSNDESFKGAITKSFKKSDIATTEKKSGALVYSGNKKDDTEEQIIRVKVKVIKLRDIFKNRYVYDKIKDKKETRDKTNDDKKKREKELEGKKKSNKFNIGKLGALMPKTGIFDWITNFLLYTILGYLNNRFEIIPKLVGLIPLIEKSMNFIVNIGGILLNGLTTFIDFGYGLVDKTKGFIKAIGGDGAAKVFDKFLGTLNTLFNLALIAAMINAGGGFGGKGKGGGAPKGGVKPGGKPRVTTSGGRTAGKPDIRNPLRQKPKVTTGTGGGKGSRLPKLPKGIKAKGAGLLGMAFLIPDLIESGMLAKEGRGKDGLRTLINAVSGTGAGMAASAATLAGAGALGLTGVGLPAAIALGIASLGVGTVAGTAAYNASDAGLRKMGLVDTDPKTGKPYQYAYGGMIGKAGAGLPILGGMMSLPPMPKLTLPNLVPTLIGNAIGGVKKLLSFFGVGTEDEAKSSSEPLINLANKVKDIPLIGGAMYAALQLALGMRVDRNVLKYVGAQFTNFSNLDAFKGISASTSRLSSALKFEEGGQVTSTVVSLSQSDNMKSVNSLATYLDREIGSIELEVIDKEPPPASGQATGTSPRDRDINARGGFDPRYDTPGGATFGGANLSKLQKQALAILSKYESAGSGGYNAVNQIGIAGGRGVAGFSGDFRKMKQHRGRALTELTIQEILNLQAEKPGMSNDEWIKQGRLHAVGRYQFIGNTLPGVVKRAGIPTNAKFTPEVQDLLGMQYLKERGIGAWVGPSDKATREERALIERARREPIKYQPQIATGSSSNPGFNLLNPSTWFGGKGGKKFPLPKGMIGTGEGQVFGAPRSYGGHAGVDVVERPPWGGDPKLPVVAYRDGTVISGSPGYSYKRSGYTSNLSIDHGGGLKVTYLHMTPGLKPGDKVSAGQNIGRLIDLGNQTHLHFQAYQDNKLINPTGLLRGAAQGGGYIGKNPKVYKGINESASYEQSGVLLMIQPMIIEKQSDRSISYGSNLSKTTFAGNGSVNSGYNPAASRG